MTEPIRSWGEALARWEQAVRDCDALIARQQAESSNAHRHGDSRLTIRFGRHFYRECASPQDCDLHRQAWQAVTE